MSSNTHGGKRNGAGRGKKAPESELQAAIRSKFKLPELMQIIDDGLKATTFKYYGGAKVGDGEPAHLVRLAFLKAVLEFGGMMPKGSSDNEPTDPEFDERLQSALGNLTQ